MVEKSPETTPGVEGCIHAIGDPIRLVHDRESAHCSQGACEERRYFAFF